MLLRIPMLFISTAVVAHNVPVYDIPVTRLNDGNVMPRFGFGTWLGSFSELDPNDTRAEKAVEIAIDTGYRHFDTASLYDDEDQVGRAVNNKINEGVIKREDVFITTKLWSDKHAREAVVPALLESLRKFNLSYVDLFLIHSPIATQGRAFESPYVDIDYVETWKGMVEARNRGLTKSIGLSNFNPGQIERVWVNTGVRPAVLQVEINLNLQQPELRAYCHCRDIAVVGYTPFGSLFPNKAEPYAPPPRVDDPFLVAIAQKYNKTVPQVVLRYLFELGVTPIPKSVTRSRIEQNLDIFDFQLDEYERKQLKTYDTNYRIINLLYWSDSPYFPF